MTASVGLSRDELRDLPAVLDIRTAARVLGISRYKAYELVRVGEWPTRVLRLGRAVRIPTAELLALIGVTAQPPLQTRRVTGGWRRP